MAAAGEAEGIHFAFDRIERTPNTLNAHRLIWLADKEGVQDAVVEALFLAYFNEGRDISNRQTLLDVVADAGLDRGKAEGVLTSSGGQEAISEANELARRVGVGGVPFFVINGKVTLSGAKPPDAFIEAFKQAVVRSPSTPIPNRRMWHWRCRSSRQEPLAPPPSSSPGSALACRWTSVPELLRPACPRRDHRCRPCP